MRSCLTLCLAILLVAGIVAAAENWNSIWIGDDVSALSPKSVAVQIDERGVVTAHMGALVPGLRDKHGNAVRITGIRLK